MKIIGNLEMHAWHGCNLVCKNCSHYSSLGLRGGPSFPVCDSWMKAWRNRLQPNTFSIVGGEPTANPELCEIVAKAIEYWPNSEIRLVTNGFLLGSHQDLPKVLSQAKRSVLVVSSHHSSAKYQAKFAYVRDLLSQWKNGFGLNVRIVESDRLWTKRYSQAPDKIVFCNSKPQKAWQACIGRYCTQLYNGFLWKCPPIAYFSLLIKENSVSSKIRKLINSYLPLQPDCSDLELTAFLTQKEELFCSICPEELIHFRLPCPLPKGY